MKWRIFAQLSSFILKVARYLYICMSYSPNRQREHKGINIFIRTNDWTRTILMYWRLNVNHDRHSRTLVKWPILSPSKIGQLQCYVLPFVNNPVRKAVREPKRLDPTLEMNIAIYDDHEIRINVELPWSILALTGSPQGNRIYQSYWSFWSGSVESMLKHVVVAHTPLSNCVSTSEAKRQDIDLGHVVEITGWNVFWPI